MVIERLAGEPLFHMRPFPCLGQQGGEKLVELRDDTIVRRLDHAHVEAQGLFDLSPLFAGHMLHSAAQLFQVLLGPPLRAVTGRVGLQQEADLKELTNVV